MLPFDKAIESAQIIEETVAHATYYYPADMTISETRALILSHEKLRRENARLRDDVRQLAERVAICSELLAKRGRKKRRRELCGREKFGTPGGLSMSSYDEFLRAKQHAGSRGGFDPIWMPDFLFDFQRHLVEWAINKGRAAIFADCGLGKTAMQLVWANNVVRKTNKPVLVLTPLAVASQSVREASKFGIEAAMSRDGRHRGGIVVTNYEKLKHFDRSQFAGVVCDESSILKNFDGKTKDAVTEFMKPIPYRLLCTATAAPNDYIELGTSSEALGELGYRDVITKFFVQMTAKDWLGWGRTKYRLRGHAEGEFWRWVCSWARAVRKPSDLGFDDGRFVLPELKTQEHVVTSLQKRPGFLFDFPAVGMQEEREEARRTLAERCEMVARLVDHDRPAVAWCHLNDEGDMISEMVDDAKQISGSQSDDEKEELLEAFASGQIRVLVTKPVIAGFGLNWQHCSHQTFFPSHSFEQWYQSIRRCWRFGQQNPVIVDVISTEGSAGVLGNLNAKAEACERMFARLVDLMNDSLRIDNSRLFPLTERVPQWLSATKS